MKLRTFFLCMIFVMGVSGAWSQKLLQRHLQQGDHQTIVVYGTSLSAKPDGWPAMLKDSINQRYPGQIEVINSAKGAMWSTWGVQHLDERVLSKHPDMVLIEFAMNDAYLPYKTSKKVCRLNLEYMIDRIQEANPQCEIVLQVMNMPIAEHFKQRPLIDEYYEIYRLVAKKRKLTLIDHYTYWTKILQQGESTFRAYVPDGIHPAERAWQEYTVPYILKTLGF